MQCYNALACCQFNVLSWPSVAFVLWLSARKCVRCEVFCCLSPEKFGDYFILLVCVFRCQSHWARYMLSTMITNFLCTMYSHVCLVSFVVVVVIVDWVPKNKVKIKYLREALSWHLRHKYFECKMLSSCQYDCLEKKSKKKLNSKTTISFFLSPLRLIMSSS